MEILRRRKKSQMPQVDTLQKQIQMPSLEPQLWASLKEGACAKDAA